MKRILLMTIAMIGVILTLINMVVGIMEDDYGKASFWLFYFIINIFALLINKEALNN